VKKSQILLGAVCLFIFAIPWQNAISIPGIGTFARISGFLMVLVYGWYLASTPQRRFPWEFVPMFGFVAWYTLSGLWAVDTTAYAGRLSGLLQLIAAVLVVWQVVTSEKALRTIYRAYIAGAYLLSFIAIKEFKKVQAAELLRAQRVTIEGFNANGIAIMLALGLPMALYLYASAEERPDWKGRLGQLFNLGYIPMAALGILLVASRGGLLVALIGSFVCFVAMLRKPECRPRAGTLLGFIAVALALFITFGPSKALVRNVERLASTGQSLKKQDLNHRQNIWKDGMPLIIENPILGVGGASFAEALRPAHGHKFPAHNVYISTAADLGIPGFALYFGFVGLIVRAVFRSASKFKVFDLALLTGVLVALATANLEVGKQVWMIYVLTLAHAKLYPSIRRESAPAALPSPA